MVFGELLAARTERWLMPGRGACAMVRRLQHLHSQQGFTVLETMIVVTIVGVVLMVGIPSFQNTVLSNRLTTSANAFVSSYNSARLTAIQRNAAVQFCGGTTAGNGSEVLGAACGTEAGAAFMLNIGGASAARIADAPVLPAGFTLASTAALRFNGQGFARAAVGGTAPYSGLLLDLSSNRLSVRNRRCVYLTTGSIISVCSVTGTGACNANEPASCQ